MLAAEQSNSKYVSFPQGSLRLCLFSLQKTRKQKTTLHLSSFDSFFSFVVAGESLRPLCYHGLSLQASLLYM